MVSESLAQFPIPDRLKSSQPTALLCDTQEMTWWSIPAYFKAYADENAKKKFKNVSQKKKYIVEQLGMPLQFDRVVLCSSWAGGVFQHMPNEIWHQGWKYQPCIDQPSLSFYVCFASHIPVRMKLERKGWLFLTSQKAKKNSSLEIDSLWRNRKDSNMIQKMNKMKPMEDWVTKWWKLKPLMRLGLGCDVFGTLAFARSKVRCLKQCNIT